MSISILFSKLDYSLLISSYTFEDNVVSTNSFMIAYESLRRALFVTVGDQIRIYKIQSSSCFGYGISFCETCSGFTDITQCDSCVPGYKLSPPNSSTCWLDCPAGEYAAKLRNGMPGCKLCSDTIPECLSCKREYLDPKPICLQCRGALTYYSGTQECRC